MEIGIWRSLFLLMRRRVAGQGEGVLTFPYAKEVAPVMGAFIFVSVLELPLVHLLIPWEAVRLVALVLSVWGVLWMVGLLASMKVFPHLMHDDGLRVRNGTSVDVAVPWSAVAAVRARRGSVPSREHVHDDGSVAAVEVLKRTNVEVVLHRPTALALPGGPREVTEVRLFADDPRAFVAAAREHVPEPAMRPR
jgi:hypothetical protein